MRIYLILYKGFVLILLLNNKDVINQIPPDGGIIYTETNMAQFFPEPLNAVTAVFFLGIAVFWTVKLKGNFNKFPFLAYCLVLLCVGAVGGSIYHGFRQWPIFIIMEWMPIMLLCLSAGFYFIAKSTKWYYAVFTVFAYLMSMYALRNWIFLDNTSLFINLNYALMSSFVLFSVLSYLIHTKWKAGRWVGFALLSFVFALTFRVSDKSDWIKIGTHFLWHTFGAIAAFCMFNYIYLTQTKSNNIS